MTIAVVALVTVVVAGLFLVIGIKIGEQKARDEQLDDDDTS